VSSSTWTPTAVASKAALLRLVLWRAVEAQHLVSTTALVDTLDEQALLEELIESVKPARPLEAKKLHWLLFTPFRYPPLPRGSRFRSPVDPGVFYGADEARTACAELGFWRWRFLLESPDLAAIDAKPQTLFSALIETSTVDLRQSPFVRDRKRWTDGRDYGACQAFGRIAREASLGAIRYESVRDPKHAGCAAVLTPEAFAETKPLDSQTWLLTVTRERVFWHRDAVLESATHEFDARVWNT
jgi:hypothetical protein